jgi:hypothetical protein
VNAIKVGRNDACACGSGRKYKHCCERKQIKREHLRDSVGKGLFYMLAPLFLVMLTVMAIASLRGNDQATDEPPKVWSAAHNHWHYRMPDGTELEVRPGMVWSPEEKRFVDAAPFSGAARKHTTNDLEQHFADTEAGAAR